MADWVFNIAKGKAAGFFDNVENNSPSGCKIGVVITSGDGSEVVDTLNNYDTVSAYLGDTHITENTGSTWARKSLAAANITAAVDDTNNYYNADMDDQTWSAVAASNDSSYLVVYYDPDGTDTDSQNVPISHHDFAVTTDGSDVTAQIAAAGIYRAS